MHQVPPELTDTVLSMYKKEFIYLNASSLVFNSQDLSVSGEVLFNLSPYLRTDKDNIFNNTEAMFVVNQIILILIACHEVGSIHLGDNKLAQHFLSEFANRLVIRKQKFEFCKPVYINESDRFVTARIINIKKTSKGSFLNIHIEIGKQSNFKIDSMLFVSQEDIHNL